MRFIFLLLAGSVVAGQSCDLKQDLGGGSGGGGQGTSSTNAASASASMASSASTGGICHKSGTACGANAACCSHSCVNGACVGPATCDDSLKNGAETDVDCGGPVCAKCQDGKVCGTNSDCLSGSCTNGICGAPAATCSDALKDGAETDIDCGGPACPKCALGKECAVNSDCLSDDCTGGLCVNSASSCNDSLKDGSETDIDCGGPVCPKCVTAKVCVVNSDCVSGACVANFCQ